MNENHEASEQMGKEKIWLPDRWAEFKQIGIVAKINYFRQFSFNFLIIDTKSIPFHGFKKKKKNKEKRPKETLKAWISINPVFFI